MKLDIILNNCRSMTLPFEQIRSALERYEKKRCFYLIKMLCFFRIDELNLRIDNLHIQLSPPPPSSVMKISSPTVDSSFLTPTNGFHQSSKRQVNNIKKKKKSYANKSFSIFRVN